MLQISRNTTFNFSLQNLTSLLIRCGESWSAHVHVFMTEMYQRALYKPIIHIYYFASLSNLGLYWGQCNGKIFMEFQTNTRCKNMDISYRYQFKATMNWTQSSHCLYFLKMGGNTMRQIMRTSHMMRSYS